MIFSPDTCQKCNESAVSWLCILVLVAPTGVHVRHPALMGLRCTLDGACTTQAANVCLSQNVSATQCSLLLKYFLWWALCSIKWSPVLNKKVSCVMQKKRVIFYATDQCNKEIKLVIFISIDVFAHASVYTQSKFLKTETCYRETFFMLPLLKPYTCTELRWKEGLSTLCWYSTKYHSVFNWYLKPSMNYHEFLKRRKKKEIQGFASSPFHQHCPRKEN